MTPGGNRRVSDEHDVRLLGDPEQVAEAEPYLCMALRFAPERAAGHNNLANVLLETGHLDQAAAEQAIALRLAPNDISVAETMGRILFRQLNYAGALQQFGRAVELGAAIEAAKALAEAMQATGQGPQPEDLAHDLAAAATPRR